MHPEVELVPGVQVPDEESRYVGREGIEEWFRSATDPWDSIRIEQLELIELPDERVLAVERWFFRGRDGIELEMELPTIHTFRDGLVHRIEGFTDTAEARRAAGLEA